MCYKSVGRNCPVEKRNEDQTNKENQTTEYRTINTEPLDNRMAGLVVFVTALCNGLDRLIEADNSGLVVIKRLPTAELVP